MGDLKMELFNETIIYTVVTIRLGESDVNISSKQQFYNRL